MKRESVETDAPVKLEIFLLFFSKVLLFFSVCMASQLARGRNLLLERQVLRAVVGTRQSHVELGNTTPDQFYSVDLPR